MSARQLQTVAREIFRRMGGLASMPVGIFENTVAALCQTLVLELRCDQPGAASPDTARTAEFVLAQCQRVPDFLRPPIRWLTVLFAIWVFVRRGKSFAALPQEIRCQEITAWRQSRLGFRRDFVRFYESLVVLGWYSFQPSGATSA
jgi:hypothetical protein